MNALILNRENAPGGWYQIEVSGEHPAGVGPNGEARVQVIDAKAMRSIVNRFEAERTAAGGNFAGMLVDADHLSHDMSQRTEAFAWLKEVSLRDGQLWGRLDVTDLGEGAIKNKRYKFFTTEYDAQDLEDLGGGKVRPLRLAGLAFTNRPNNRGGKPISNRDQEPARMGNQNNTTNMKAIAEKLGLSADADEAAILSAIDSLLAKKAEGEAEAVMNRHAERIPSDKKDEVKAELIKNRASGLEMILGFPLPDKKEMQERIHNRESSSSPAPVESSQSDKVTAEDEKKAGAIRNRAHSIAKERNIPFNQAFGQAQAELG